MRANRRVWLGTVAAVAVAVLALSGCSSNSPKTLSGVVGTGTLQPAAGSVMSARFEIVADPSSKALVVKLVGLKGKPKSEIDLNLSSQRVAAGDSCAPGGITLGLGRISSKPNQSFSLPTATAGGPSWQNPSFLRDATLTEEKLGTNCGSYLLAAYAPLKWTIGDIRPDIKVSDGGSRVGARGTVIEENGALRSYTVVAGDNFSSIGERFHITVDDIYYLNPARSPSPEDPNVEIGEVLNLSKAHR
ncbi:MAG TPA: LysM domain-containing protein [Galbitalea sp.]|jgi:hypothetical protein|nr:LysM domain-containing protein [Galbitalea sp.]